MEENNIPKVNNSKKISQLKARDAITYHQDHSWIAIAQYNDKIGSYHNIAMNIASITGYAISKTQELNSYMIDERLEEFSTTYNISYISDLGKFQGEYDYDRFSYAIVPNTVSYNLVSYVRDYTEQSIMWDYYPSIEFNNVKIQYLTGEDGIYLLTDRGKKLRID